MLCEDLQTHRIPHGEKKFYDHLSGTYTLLRVWGNGSDVARAGLFHSIYGTQFLESTEAQPDVRRWVRGLIGRRAERLVYLFCVGDRRRFLSECQIGNGVRRIYLRDSGRTVRVSVATLGSLLEIELANLIDQMPKKKKSRYRIDFDPAWATVEKWVSRKGYSHFRRSVPGLFLSVDGSRSK